MSIAAWVWASSPASRDEGLVLLALADACSHDDGTGRWPRGASNARTGGGASPAPAGSAPRCRTRRTAVPRT